jgi:hypothetical protein
VPKEKRAENVSSSVHSLVRFLSAVQKSISRRDLKALFLSFLCGKPFFFSRRDLRGAEILRTLPFTTGKYRNPQSPRRLRHNPTDDRGVDVTIGEEGGHLAKQLF